MKFRALIAATFLASPVYAQVNIINDEFHRRYGRALYPGDPFYKNALIFAGNSNNALANEIARYLNLRLGDATVGTFADGECNIQVQENVRGRDIYVIQGTNPPVNDNLMELLLLVSTFRRASAKSITVIMPYYGYARQDHKQEKASSISAADIARLLETSGIDRMVAVNLHRGQIQGFFSPKVPVDNMEANITLLNFISLDRSIDMNNLVLVSPDFNGVPRVKRFQELLSRTYPQVQSKLAMIHKEKQTGLPPIMSLVGDVQNKNCLIVDDIIDSGQTLIGAVQTLHDNGAKTINAYATHAIFSTDALNRIMETNLDQLVITDTIPHNQEHPKLTCLSVAPLLAETIYRIQMRQSLSKIF